MQGWEDLLRKYCKRGDQAAFTRFYEQQAPKLWRFFLARGCDSDTAYDLLSETFLRFIQTVCQNPAAPIPLLYRIAQNLRIDLFRREQHRPVPVDPAVFSDIPAEDTDSHEMHQTLKALQNLSEHEQNLLLMRYWVGMNHKETAQAMDLPEGTVRRQAVAALYRLRALLES